MNKENAVKSILKSIGIVLLIYVVLSWFIPGGTFSELTFTKDKTYPLGLGDIITYPIATIFSADFSGIPFVIIGLIFLAIGGLYGVMNATGVYTKLVDSTVSSFKDKKHIFLMISILLLAILSSLTTLSLPIFILVPFMVTVIILLGYNKVVALLSTVGAILVGNMATIYGYNKESLSYFNILFGNSINDLIAMKLVLFIVSISILILFILMCSKKESNSTKKTKKEEKTDKIDETILLYDKQVKTKKSAMPLIVMFILLFILILVGMYAWEGAFGIKIFSDLHEAITSFKINGHPILADILGTSNRYLGWAIGTWNNYDLVIILLIASIIIGKVYGLKFSDILISFKDGAKQMSKVALIAILANVVYLIVVVSYSSGQTIFIASIISKLVDLAKGMNYFIISGITIVSAPLFNELPYLMAMLQQPLMAGFKNYPLLTVIMQTIYGFMMLVLPTSVILVAGMSYLNISIKEYFKATWKLLLVLLLAITAVILLFMYCPGIKVM